MIVRPAGETILYLGVSALACAALLLKLLMPATSIQMMALAAGVALIGLPHGALDPLLAARAGFIKDWRGAIFFHAAYLAAAAAVLAIWLLVPVLSLSIFLLYSAHHFAGDWMDRPLLARSALGAAILSLPAVAHISDVSNIYVMLSLETGRQIADVQHGLGPVWIGVIGIACATLLARRSFWHATEIAMVAISALLLPPLVFFLLYFCGLHSPRHFLHVWQASADKRQATKVAIIYTAATLAIAIPAALAFPGEIASTLPRIVFIGLAALTVPHMILSSLLKARSL